MNGDDALLALFAAIQSLSLTCGFLLDSLGDIVRACASRGLVGAPGSPFRKALEELVRIGMVDGSIDMRLLFSGGSALELAGREDSPSSMNRLLRCPSGSWPVDEVEDDRVEVEGGSSESLGVRLKFVCIVLSADMQYCGQRIGGPSLNAVEASPRELKLWYRSFLWAIGLEIW